MAEKEKKKDAIAVKPNQAMAAMNYQSDAGAGTEGADASSFAIPFYLVLQPMSPIVVDSDGKVKAGQFLNTITERVESNLMIIPVAFERKMIGWGPREEGGGFKGIWDVSEMDTMVKLGQFVRDEKNKIVDNAKKPTVIIKDTRQHYVMVHDPVEDIWVESLISMASTQIKRSKRWLTQMSTFKMKNIETGIPFTPATYSRIFGATTEKEENDKGKWFSWVIQPAKMVEEPWLYEAAKSFNRRIVKKEVKVDYTQTEKAEGDDSGKGGGGEADDGSF